MKKALSISMLIVLILMLPACSSNTSSPNKSNKKKDVILEKMTATEVEQMLKDGGFPLKEITTYDEKTDPNLLLGRPNGYKSKALVNDTLAIQTAYDNAEVSDFQTIEEFEKDNYLLGVDVEVFETHSLAKKRMDYLQSLSAPLVYEYDYLQGATLMRVSGYLTPEQAKQYEKALNDMANGKKPKYEAKK